MRRAFLLVLLALPLAGFDCGGKDPAPPTACTVSVAGEVSETLWCAGSLFDFTQLNPPQAGFSFQLAMYRGSGLPLPAGNVSIDLPAVPALETDYGWDSSLPWSNVDLGDAIRLDAGMMDTHEAMAPGVGRLRVRFTALPPIGPNGAQTGFHGTLTATLPSLSGGADVTMTATF